MSLKNSKFISTITSRFVWLISTFIGLTWRLTIEGNMVMNPRSPSGSGRIFCFWHSRLLPISFIFRNSKQTAVVSRSRDGQLAADVARMWKHDIIAGSSHRGGSVVVRQCAKVLKENGDIAITPDGPRGPVEVVKPGVAQLALLSHAPVVVLSVRPESAWYLKSWDKFMIPKPFTKVTITISDPIDSSMAGDGEDRIDGLCQLIQEKLDGKT